LLCPFQNVSSFFFFFLKFDTLNRSHSHTKKKGEEKKHQRNTSTLLHSSILSFSRHNTLCVVRERRKAIVGLLSRKNTTTYTTTPLEDKKPFLRISISISRSRRLFFFLRRKESRDLVVLEIRNFCAFGRDTSSSSLKREISLLRFEKRRL
jgi:hypothetical protein